MLVPRTCNYVSQRSLNLIDPYGLDQMNRSPYAPGGPNSQYGGGTSSGFGGQMGTTTFGPGGAGQSGSVGIAAYYEICEDKDECSNDTDPPFFLLQTPILAPGI